MIHLAVDPGKHQAGGSLWQDARLIGVVYTRYQKETRNCARDMVHWCGNRLPGKLTFEWPVIYRESAQKHKDPNDLLPLTYMLGGVALAFPSAIITELEPREWKGTIPKTEDENYIVKKRVEARLHDDELAIVLTYVSSMPEDKRHNVWDAVGIGLHGEGRGILQTKVRVIHR